MTLTVGPRRLPRVHGLIHCRRSNQAKQDKALFFLIGQSVATILPGRWPLSVDRTVVCALPARGARARRLAFVASRPGVRRAGRVGATPMRCAKVSGQRRHVGCGVPAAQKSWVMWRRQRGRLSSSPTRAVAWFVWLRPRTRRVHSNTWSADCAVEISKFSRIHGVVHQQ